MEDCRSHLNFLAVQMQHLLVLPLENNHSKFHQEGGKESHTAIGQMTQLVS